MTKPIEQRIGGPNSIDSLINKGLYAKGVRTDITEVELSEGKTIKVKPIISFTKEGTFTIFKPSNGQK
jgi:hypothetical protein